MQESKKQIRAVICERTAAALRKNGFDAVFVETIAEAAAFVAETAKSAKTIGLGGSASVGELGVVPKLAECAEILNHSAPDLTPEQRFEVMRRQQTCNLFLCSANAISTNGDIVNIDGNGNRAGAAFFGPTKILIVAGSNKIAEGGVAEALKRAKDFACAPNAHRLSKQTPCATTGKCVDCDSPDRLCRVTVVMERKPARSDITVLLVAEELGF